MIWLGLEKEIYGTSEAFIPIAAHQIVTLRVRTHGPRPWTGPWMNAIPRRLLHTCLAGVTEAGAFRG
jgi:hypothetical protein